MDYWLATGLIGSVASVIGLFLPAQSRNQRLIHVIYGLAIFFTACIATWYWSQNNRVHSIERAANILVQRASLDYTDQGFVQAALAFLEKNRDLYPDAYARAIKLTEDCKCLSGSASVEAVGLAFQLRGLLRGIGALEGNR